MAKGDFQQWQKALVIYFMNVLIFALILGVTLYFDLWDKAFLAKLGVVAAILIAFPFVVRLPLSIGAFFFHLDAALSPIGTVLSVALALSTLIPAIACFWFFASGFEEPFFGLLTQSAELVMTTDFRWWHYAVVGMSACMSFVGIYGAFKKRI